MTYEACKAWVDKNLVRLMTELGIPHWRVTVAYERIENMSGNARVAADVNPRSEYESALVRIDYDNCEEEDMERYMLHELMHCVCSPIRHFFQVATSLAKSTVEVELLQEVFSHTDERVVKNLERMRHFVIMAHTDTEIVQEVATVDDDKPVSDSGNDHEDDGA